MLKKPEAGKLHSDLSLLQLLLGLLLRQLIYGFAPISTISVLARVFNATSNCVLVRVPVLTFSAFSTCAEILVASYQLRVVSRQLLVTIVTGYQLPVISYSVTRLLGYSVLLGDSLTQLLSYSDTSSQYTVPVLVTSYQLVVTSTSYWLLVLDSEPQKLLLVGGF